ncbi:MAG: hypothetical protein HY287_15975 [Planctomycetes bacterium]|nr:hypothetical protein [Planctomycetota bacterium]
MNDEEVRTLLRRRPFTPIELALSDGRSITIRHPDQAAVSRRTLYVALVKMKPNLSRMTTPSTGEEIAKDWLLLDLIHIVSAEPANGAHPTRPRKRPKK